MTILEAKIRAMEKAGAEHVVLTSNPGCMMQLALGNRMWGQAWELSHISQIPEKSLRRGETAKAQ